MNLCPYKYVKEGKREILRFAQNDLGWAKQTSVLAKDKTVICIMELAAMMLVKHGIIHL